MRDGRRQRRRRRRRRRQRRQCGVRNEKSDGDLNGSRVACPDPACPFPLRSPACPALPAPPPFLPPSLPDGSASSPCRRCTCARGSEFPREAPLFPRRREEEEGSCGPEAGRSWREREPCALEITQKAGIIFGRSPSPGIQYSRPLCQLVTWVPQTRKKRRVKGRPSRKDRDRIPLFLTPGCHRLCRPPGVPLP
jgi:hypothetical protein